MSKAGDEASDVDRKRPGASDDLTEEERRATRVGWLGQSTVPPKKQKTIEGVRGSSILELKAQVLKKQEEARVAKELGQVPDQPRPKPVAARTNQGVEGRMRRDMEAHAAAHPTAASSRLQLERKAALYDKVMRGEAELPENVVSVDFLQKRYIDLKGRQEDAAGRPSTSGAGAGAAPPRPPPAPPRSLPSGSLPGGMYSADMATEAERQAWEERELAAMEEERVREEAREQRRATFQQLEKETQRGRAEAATAKNQKEQALKLARDKLKASFVQKHVEKMKAAAGAGPAPGAGPNAADRG